VQSAQPPWHWEFSRKSARGWGRAVRCWFILLACIAQSFVFAQHKHASIAHSHVIVAAGSRHQFLSTGLEHAAVRCAKVYGHAGSSGHGSPSPCQEDNCPCCPLADGAAAILPQEFAYASNPPRHLRTIALPVYLGALTRPVTHNGQPRAPPIQV
jgi:hypothetical protein